MSEFCTSCGNEKESPCPHKHCQYYTPPSQEDLLQIAKVTKTTSKSTTKKTKADSKHPFAKDRETKAKLLAKTRRIMEKVHRDSGEGFWD